MGVNLSSTDIDLLKIIRDINLNPGEYEGTEGGVVPATTTAIRKATDLSRSQINYRLAPSQGGYFGDDGRGLVKIHQAQIVEDTSAFGPKSMELTQKGIDALSEYTGGMEPSSDGDGTGGASHRGDEIDTASEREVIRQLHAKIDSLERKLENGGGYVDGDLGSDIERVESKVDNLSADLARVKESGWGGVDEDNIEDLEKVLNRARGMMYAFSAVLQIDVDDIIEAGGYTDQEMDEARKQVLMTLDSAAGDVVGVESALSGGASKANGSKPNEDGEVVSEPEPEPESRSGSGSGQESGTGSVGSSDIPEPDPDGWESKS